MEKTNEQIFTEHNAHDAEGNCLVPFSSRCACGPCCAVDGIAPERAAQMATAKTRNL